MKRDSRLPEVWGLSEVADYYGVSRVLANKWRRESADFPEPAVRLRMGPVWVAEDVKAWGKRHERKRREGPREAHDTRTPRARKRAAQS